MQPFLWKNEVTVSAPLTHLRAHAAAKAPPKRPSLCTVAERSILSPHRRASRGASTTCGPAARPDQETLEIA